jgi:hypothetical protein
VKGILVPLVAASIASLGACGGGEPSPEDRCNDACKRDRMCNLNEGSLFCRDDCPERALGLEQAYFETYMDCYSELECDLPIASCETEAANRVERREIDGTFQTACQTKHRECDDLFKSAFCFQSHYYETEFVERANACLLMTCDAVEQCLLRELPFAPFGR